MGFCTSQSNRTKPLPASWVPVSFPLDTPTNPAGTIRCIFILSASSLRWSLQGSQQLAPRPSQARPTQSFPLLSFCHTKPPSHGALCASGGLPEKYTSIFSVLFFFTFLP